MGLLGKFCSLRLEVGKQQGGRGGRRFYVLGTCLSSGLFCSWQQRKDLSHFKRGETATVWVFIREFFQEIEGQPESQHRAV